MFLMKCLFLSVLLMISDGLSVKGLSAPLVVPVGGSVVLNCSSDELLPVEDLEVEWRKRNSETLVHLFSEGKSREEVQQQEHQGRAHFFTDQIPQGNFSLLLERVRAEDQGEYTCKVYSGEDSAETVVQIKDVERLLVSGSDVSVSAYVGEDVTLNCSVNSHEDIDEVSWKKRETDGDVLVLRWSEVKSDSSDERYRDRVQFFSAETSRGNFSVRLKSVRTEDKGVYMCQVFAGDLQANATVTINRLGLSGLHKTVLILSAAASTAALLIFGLMINYRSANRKSAGGVVLKALPCLHVVLPNLLMFVSFLLWGLTEGSLDETVLCCALFMIRPLMLFAVTPYSLYKIRVRLQAEFVLFLLVYFSVLFRHTLEKIRHYSDKEKVLTVSVFVVFILLSVFFIVTSLIRRKLSCTGEIWKWILRRITLAGAYSIEMFPSLSFMLLFFAFGASVTAMLFTALFPFLLFISYSCVFDVNKKKTCINLLNIVVSLIVLLLLTTVMMYILLKTMEHQADVAGWISATVFQQLLWMMVMYNRFVVVVENDNVFCRKIVYVFGSVFVVLGNSAALMNELIQKSQTGKRFVTDLRIIVFASESFFTLLLLIFFLFNPWIREIKCCQNSGESKRETGRIVVNEASHPEQSQIRSEQVPGLYEEKLYENC